jgi:xanthine dehydrogenase YagS FAD-binding subunit
MRPFDFVRADNSFGAVQAVLNGSSGQSRGAGHEAAFLAGGTTLLDLMKLDVMRPGRVVDINALADGDAGRIAFDDRGLRLGAMVRMADAADHPGIRNAYPMLAQTLVLAASAQIRNMASLGGNVLQRTRCSYFRDVSNANCNKRNPGSGCAALEGFNRTHAVLGTSAQCIATYPGDFAQALIALDARVSTIGQGGLRQIAFADLLRPPGDRPEVERNLAPGELITEFIVPATPFARRSLYLKIRDRESYEFALASAAVALDIGNGNVVRESRIALGGVATIPWRAREAEAILNGQALSEEVAMRAARAAFADARPSAHNVFKVELGQRTLMRALQQAATMSI